MSLSCLSSSISLNLKPRRKNAALLAAAIGLLGMNASVQASSHREAPFISTQPKVDATDFYMFSSYEPGRTGYVTLIANYAPLQDAYGGPNYFSLDPEALYEIHISNQGAAKESLTFQFRFNNKLNDVALNVGGKQVAIPLIQAGGVAAGDSSKLNISESYSVNVVRGNRRTGTVSAVKNAVTQATTFIKPVDFIGTKTFGSVAGYASYAAQYVYNINIPGCGVAGKMFVGQRKDPFVVALGKAFDLINLNPLGAPDANPDNLADKNVTSIALELPKSCVTAGDEIIGAWTTASLRQGRLLVPTPASGNTNAQKNGGAWTQVSRLGMPLVNELVIGLKDKDKFNHSKPEDDAQFADYVTNPTFPALIETLFPSAPAPKVFPRKDLVTTFLTGIDNLNKPQNVVASEMLRLNTNTAATARASQNNLGVLGGDAAGYPNGRRPGDDVVDITLRVAMGALCTLNNAAVFGCVSSDAPAGGAALTDGAKVDASMTDGVFPYLKAPIPGATQ